MGHRMRLWSLEWLAICVQELSRAALGEQKAYVLFDKRAQANVLDSH